MLLMFLSTWVGHEDIANIGVCKGEAAKDLVDKMLERFCSVSKTKMHFKNLKSMKGVVIAIQLGNHRLLNTITRRFRAIIDYSTLYNRAIIVFNNVTKPDRYPIPHIQGFTTTATGQRIGCLLYVTDRESRLCFLVDTSAEVSIIPPFKAERKN